MKSVSRREFVKATAGGAAVGALIGAGAMNLFGDPLGLPIGLQLYTVGSDLEKDFNGTLKRISDIGYRAVETAGFMNKSASEFRKALDNVGLKCPSGHCVQATMTTDELAKLIDYCKELGMEYMVCAAFATGNLASMPKGLTAAQSMAWFGQMVDKVNLDDYKRTAELFNKLGAQIKKGGLQFAYHNHSFEFREFNGVVAYDQLLADTDKDLVKYEIDCGWVSHAGHDPAALITKYPDRIRMLHVKDEKAGYKPTTEVSGGAPTTEVGRGHVDWKAVFMAAKKTKIDHYFVEQEPPFPEMPPLDAIKVSYDYLHALNV